MRGGSTMKASSSRERDGRLGVRSSDLKAANCLPRRGLCPPSRSGVSKQSSGRLVLTRDVPLGPGFSHNVGNILSRSSSDFTTASGHPASCVALKSPTSSPEGAGAFLKIAANGKIPDRTRAARYLKKHAGEDARACAGVTGRR